MTAQSKSVLRAEHMKRIKAARAKLDEARAAQAAALKEFHQSIRDAYADGIHGAPIREASGLHKNSIYEINR